MTELQYADTGELLLIEDISRFDENFQLQKSSIVSIYGPWTGAGQERRKISFPIEKKSIRCATYAPLQKKFVAGTQSGTEVYELEEDEEPSLAHQFGLPPDDRR